MLEKLSIDNLAVIEHAEADFAPGFNVLTGETGAGKSVIMGALSLALGGRADSSAVREGAAEARVSAEWRLSGPLASAVDALLADSGLEGCEDGELLVRRTLGADGRGKAWINGAAAPLAVLRHLGTLLADFHGPRANQRLSEESFQREALDAYGAIDRRRYDAAWAALSALRQRRDELNAIAAGNVEEELEMLRFQTEEFRSAELSEEDETLAERHAAAARAGEIIEAANAVTEALGGERGAAEALVQAAPHLAALARRLPAAAEWTAKAESLTLELQELSRTVADAASALEADEEELEELDRRLTLVNRLKRKFRVQTVGELLTVERTKTERLQLLEGRERELAALGGQIAAAEAAVTETASQLTASRQSAATRLGAAITAELRELGFLQAQFSVALGAVEPSASGADRVVYLFGPNPGEPARPLADIASSGEIARVMLAVKTVLADAPGAGPAVATLVFDEIDANIGGEIALVVGAKLRRIAAGRQVIAITHLPQSAAAGDRQLVVVKTVTGGRTTTGIAEVRGEARVSEIARMLGGEGLTSVVRKHAQELLELSR